MSSARNILDAPTITETAREMVMSHAPVPHPEQKYAVVVAVAPKEAKLTNQYAKVMGINILGAFATVGECKEFIRENQENGFVNFDMHIILMNRFAVFPPPTRTTDTEYSQEMLGSLFDSHKKDVNMASRKIQERIEMDKITESTLHTQAKLRQGKAAKDAIANPSAGDSVGVQVEDAKHPDIDPKATKTKRVEMSTKMQRAKSRARRKGNVMSNKKRTEMQKIIQGAMNRLDENTDGDDGAGVFDGLPSASELKGMSDEQKAVAGKALEDRLRLAQANGAEMKCVLGKPQFECPVGVTPIKLG